MLRPGPPDRTCGLSQEPRRRSAAKPACALPPGTVHERHTCTERQICPSAEMTGWRFASSPSDFLPEEAAVRVPTPPPRTALFHRRQVLPNKQMNKPQTCSYHCLTFRHTDPTGLRPRSTSHPVAVTGPLRTSFRRGHQQRHGGGKAWERSGACRSLLHRPEPEHHQEGRPFTGLPALTCRSASHWARTLDLQAQALLSPLLRETHSPMTKPRRPPPGGLTLTPASSMAGRRPLPRSRQTK